MNEIELWSISRLRLAAREQDKWRLNAFSPLAERSFSSIGVLTSRLGKILACLLYLIFQVRAVFDSMILS